MPTSEIGLQELLNQCDPRLPFEVFGHVAGGVAPNERQAPPRLEFHRTNLNPPEGRIRTPIGTQRHPAQKSFGHRLAEVGKKVVQWTQAAFNG